MGHNASWTTHQLCFFVIHLPSVSKVSLINQTSVCGYQSQRVNNKIMAMSCNDNDAFLISFQHHSSLAASCLLLGHEPLLRIKSKPERLPRHCQIFLHCAALLCSSEGKKGFSN